MKLIVISSHKPVEDEGRKINEFFTNGLELFHLRKPDYSQQELESLILRISPAFHQFIILHSHHSLVHKYKLKGIHIPSRKRTSALQSYIIFNKYRIFSPTVQLSTSFHRTHELMHNQRNYNYVLLSPVFKSISKSHYLPLYSESEMKNAISKSRQNVIALGGISLETAEKVFEIGFYGMAVMGAIWTSPNPVESFIAINRKVIELSEHTQRKIHAEITNNGTPWSHFQRS